MKKILIFLALSAPLWAVGTCNVNNNNTPVVTVSCTGDASTGSFPATPITGLVYPLSQVEIVPGSTAPTNNFSVTLTDANGADQLSGQATNLGPSGTQSYAVSSTRTNTGNLTLNITGNSVASATVVVWLYLGQNSPTPPGRGITEKGTRWALNNTPAAAAQATTSKAAVAGVRHVADCVSFAAAATAAVTAGTGIAVNLRDGATGAGTVLWTMTLNPVSAAAGGNAGVSPISVCGLALIGSPNTAMTLEYSAGVTGAIESVALSGYDLE